VVAGTCPAGHKIIITLETRIFFGHLLIERVNISYSELEESNLFLLTFQITVY